MVAILAISVSRTHDETPEVREWDIAHQTLPDFKIALLADFFSKPEDLERLSLIKRQLIIHDPDLILYAGDYIGSQSIYKCQQKNYRGRTRGTCLSQARFAVLGNHGNWDSHEAGETLSTTLRFLLSKTR